jgi:amino acid adenylation domain-containing protein
MTSRPAEDIYRLSFMQQGLLFHSLVDPEAAFYVDQVVHTLTGPLDVDRLTRAWRWAVERHETLRTSFHWEGVEELVQAVHATAEVSMERHDWRALPAAEHESALPRFLAEDRLRGFDLERPPLFRLSLVRHADDCHTFAFRYHHLLLDAWSALMVLDEVFTDYERESPEYLPRREPPLAYRDYVAWLHRQDLTEAERYWRGALRGFREPTPLPGTAHTHDVSGNIEHDHPEEVLTLPADTLTALTELARSHNITLNSLLQGAWSLLLSRHSGRQDVVFGTTTSHRPAELDGVQHTAGVFINTLPVRVRMDRDDTFVSCCRRLLRAEGERRGFDHSPLVRVQEWSELPPGIQLFDTITTFLNVPGIDGLGGRDGTLSRTQGTYVYRTNYPLSVIFLPGSGQLSIRVVYDRRRYDSAAARRILGGLRTMLDAIAADAALLVRDVPLMTDDEEDRLIQQWGGAVTGADDRPQAADDVPWRAHDLVTEQARRSPDAMALVHGETRVTYAELVGRARRLAHHLRGLGVVPEIPVGVCLERGPNLPVALLAVLMAGGVYVPLDPDYPGERLSHMLRDARPHVVLAERRTHDRLHREGRHTVLLDADADAFAEESEAPLGGTHVSPDNLAYVIYTSGSTGLPKGTMLSHRGLSNLIRAQRESFTLTGEDRVLQWASASFDASVFEMVLALAAGAELHLTDRDEAVPGEDLLCRLADSAITCLTVPPSVLSALPEAELPALRLLITAGEALPATLAARWAGGRRMVNAYGPTETSVWATARDVGDDTGAPPIGAPVHGFRAYVLDTALRPVPVGAIGELLLAGPGVARGYLGLPARTAAAFLPDPYGPPGARMYRSGDLARWRADGALEFVGRADHQVKIRGFRIELGEIETVLGGHPDVIDRAVVVRDGPAGTGDEQIVAYAVPRAGARTTGQELRRYLAERLPSHMVPGVVVLLDRLPLTPNGKLERAALPAPEEVVEADGKVSPRTDIERFMAEIWCEVLGVDDPSVTDDFFEAGGNSIKVAQLGARMRNACAADIPLRAVLGARTLEQCAVLVEEALARRIGSMTEDEIRALAEEGA